MPDSTMTPPHHYPTLHEVWEEIHTVAGESLVSHWIDDAPDEDDQQPESDGLSFTAFSDQTGEQEEKDEEIP